jgi:hypothetical protein
VVLVASVAKAASPAVVAHYSRNLPIPVVGQWQVESGHAACRLHITDT